MSEWISVKDRMPLTDTYVLTWGYAETVTQMLYTRHNGENYWDCRNIDKHYLLSQNPVTHWMPLPEPPKDAS